ncbi:MAG: hypothetical protein J6S72_10505 [Lachnospiraceae bacterium]|nr:hypothetical protein [Lachnospiraceae bacterium]
MNRTLWKCTGAFTPMSYRIAVIIGMILTSVIGFILSDYMGLASALVVAPIALVIIVFVDYFAFSGISTRREKCMELMKSSLYGREIIGKALKADTILKIVTVLLCFAGCIIGCFMGGVGIMFVLAVMFTTMAITVLVLIFTRRKGLNTAVQMMLTYLGVTLLDGVMLGLLFATINATEEETAGMNAIDIAILSITLGMAALTILLGFLLYRDCIKGYESGFLDRSEKEA